MKSSLFKATVFLAAAALAASVGVADAQVDKDNGKCRGTIGKNATKLNATTMKTMDGCVKNALKAGSGNCTTIAAVDTKGKIGKSIGKLTDSLVGAKAKCVQPLHDPTLAEHVQCSSPSNGFAIASFADLNTCLIELNDKNAVALHNDIITPDYGAILAHPLAKDLTKCANAIAKNAGKLHKTIGKERSKDVKASDKLLGPYNYESGSADPKNKIASTTVKTDEGIRKACDPLKGADLLEEGANMNLVGSCDDTVDGVVDCVINKVTSSAGGLTAVAYDQPGECATQADVSIRHLDTVLDVGWTGFGHNADTADDFTARVNVTCGAAPNDCSSCAISPSCEGGNCRCDLTPSTICTTPNGPDAACGGGLCNNFFGPPLPLSAAGTPTCVVNKVQSLTGTANLQDGSSASDVDNLSVVFLGEGQSNPCPTCDGGLCTNGDNDGGACTVDAVSPTFGNLSYSCQPESLKNVSGAGLTVPLDFDSSSTSLPFAQSCDAPLGALSCACAVCSLDGSVGCNVDADCAAVGAGTCTGGKGTGVSRAPNGCADGICTEGPTDIGTCGAGPTDSFCSGVVKTSGLGVAPCTTDADCTILGPQYGTCTTSALRPCFLDPIDAAGAPGLESATLVASFCVAPTASGAVNAAAGSPGPGRISAAFEFLPYCADNTTIWGPGGANCQ